MRSLIVLLVTAAPGIFLIKLFSGLGITLYLIILWVFIVAIITGCTMIRKPSSNWLTGGGEYIDQILLKKYIRKKKRCLYIKGYNQLAYEEKMKQDLGYMEKTEEK